MTLSVIVVIGSDDGTGRVEQVEICVQDRGVLIRDGDVHGDRQRESVINIVGLKTHTVTVSGGIAGIAERERVRIASAHYGVGTGVTSRYLIESHVGRDVTVDILTLGYYEVCSGGQ